MPTSYELDSNASSKIKTKLAKSSKSKLFDGFEGNKTVNEALDKSAVMTIYGMIKSGIISYVNGIVSAGKESVVFWAVGDNSSDIALKVHLVSTANFKKRMPYIDGDPRFGFTAGRPFFSFVSSGSIISCFFLHLTQYASVMKNTRYKQYLVNNCKQFLTIRCTLKELFL